MSQIRRSASFRSRIPVRRAKPTPRRCYSPEPYKRQTTDEVFHQHQNDYDTKQHNHVDQKLNKQKMKRQRNVAITLAKMQNLARPSKDTSTDTSASNFPARPKTIYSSSSYSSSDESQESESPPQVYA